MFSHRCFRSRLPWACLGVFSLLAVNAPDLFAQDGAGAGEAAGKGQTLLDLIQAGGWAMWPLGALSVAMITLIVYNMMQLTRGKFAPKALKRNFLANMEGVLVRSAIEECAASPSYLGRMAATSLPFVDATEPETLGRDRVEDEMAEFIVRENPNYMSWVGYFSIIAQASPMIGLLGTVSGMIKAFQTMGVDGSNPEKLAAAISEALMTTASGLVVAIPCLFFFYFFKNKFQRLVSECQDTMSEAMDLAITAVNADQQLAKVPEGLAEHA